MEGWQVQRWRARFPSQLAALDWLRRNARANATVPAVRKAALDVLTASAMHRTPIDRARALLQWTAGEVAFIPDPYRSELFQSPEVTLRMRAGDCDDHAVLLGAMTTAVGIPTRLCASGNAGELSHVFPVVELDGRWTALDSTLPHPGIGHLASHDTFRATAEV